MLVAQSCPTLCKPIRQEYWSGWPFLSPGALPRPGIKPGSPALQADFFLPPEPPGKPLSSKSTLYTWRCVRVGQGSCKIRCFLWAGFLLPGSTDGRGGEQNTAWEEKGLASSWACPRQWPSPHSYGGCGLHFLSSLLETPAGLPIRTSTARHHSSSKGWVLGQGNSPLGSWSSSSHAGLPPQKSESQLGRTPPWVLTCQLCHTANSLHIPHPKCELWIHRTPPPSC